MATRFTYLCLNKFDFECQNAVINILMRSCDKTVFSFKKLSQYTNIKLKVIIIQYKIESYNHL